MRASGYWFSHVTGSVLITCYCCSAIRRLLCFAWFAGSYFRDFVIIDGGCYLCVCGYFAVYGMIDVNILVSCCV
jgi:hypothetical protein